MGSTSGTTSLFTGASAYSQDFQNLINRAVSIANLPIQLLQNQQAALTNQSKAMGALDTKFQALQSAVDGITDALSGSSFSASIGDPTVVGASLSDGASEGIYSIQVNNIGAYATSLTAEAWDATPPPTGQQTTFGLLVGSQEYTFTPADNSAKTVCSKINSLYGSLLTASPVNVGNGSWRISLKSNTLGPVNLDLVRVPSSGVSVQQQDPSGYAMSQTKASWNTGAGPFTLVVGGNSYALAPADNSAQSVAAAINASAAAGAVQADMVNLGTADEPDYRIQLISKVAGDVALDLQDGSAASLQAEQASATSLSAATWNPAVDAPGTHTQYTLTVGTADYSFIAVDNSAASVASAINSQYGGLVNATVVDLGSAGSHDYRIALASRTGEAALDLNKATATSLQQQQTTGRLANYSIDGAAAVDSTTRNVTVTDGVTLNLLKTGINPVDVTVTRSTSALSSALSTFADAYNATVDEVATERGQGGGALQGLSLVNLLSNSLREISTYRGSDTISGLRDLGVELKADGHLKFNAFTLIAKDLSNSAGVTSFFGSATDGGFLKTATDLLKGLEDSVTGLLKNAESDVQNQITSITNQISAKQAQVDLLQTNLIKQMSRADALIASMEQQYSYLNNMFQAQQTAAQMYR